MQTVGEVNFVSDFIIARVSEIGKDFRRRGFGDRQVEALLVGDSKGQVEGRGIRCIILRSSRTDGDVRDTLEHDRG